MPPRPKSGKKAVEEEAPPPLLAGRGEFAFEDGSTYTGEWKEAAPGGPRQRHGHGLWSLADGKETYDGQWTQDVMQGLGKWSSATGDSYDGQWVDGMYHGYGTYNWPDGCKYEGAWQAGRMHGEGTYYNAAGVAFPGQYINGKLFNGQALLHVR